jgi:GT2 family glycosyltransferase
MEHNTGFAFAVNRGIEQAVKNKSEYVFILNNDTILDKECLEKLFEGLTKHPEASSVQPKIMNAFHKDRIDSMGIVITRDMSALNKFQSRFDHDVEEGDTEIFGTTGCAALYRTSALESVRFPDGNYFDESYFAYYEDVDMSFRLRYQGFTSWCISDAGLYHAHSATGVNYSGFKSFHIHRNHLYNVIKNMPFPAILSMLWRIPFRYILLVSSAFRKKGPSYRLGQNVGTGGMVSLVIRSWWEFVNNISSLVTKRKFIMTHKKVSQSEAKEWFSKFGVALGKTIYEERI